MVDKSFDVKIVEYEKMGTFHIIINGEVVFKSPSSVVRK